ncbi:hypothetical protein [Marinobacterium stanieri]|uniref:hypothetical protein n=1 Tax=Marinobacterium stanieri TaxID=49186 RepID=UPI000255884F|nr:hypothetical protein [Marinobacterium stanieri]
MSKNVQNQIVIDQMTKANTAMHILQGLGLTVLSITGIGERPLIQIYPGRGCQQLASGATKHITRNGRRITERVSLVADCQVRWEERS